MINKSGSTRVTVILGIYLFHYLSLGRPDPVDYDIGFDVTPEYGEETTVVLYFHSNPGPTNVMWFLYDVPEPLTGGNFTNTRSVTTQQSYGRYTVGEINNVSLY